jgi:AraC-like DNA-binding protein
MPVTPRSGFHDPPGTVRVIAEMERVAIGGRLGRVSRHRLAAPAVVVGVDGPLRLRADSAHDGRAVLVRPGCWHAIDASAGRMAVFFLSPHALHGDRRAWVQDLPHPGQWVELGEALLNGQLDTFQPVDDCLVRSQLEIRPIDDRLRAAMQVLRDALDENLAIEEVASAAHISPSRLMTLAHEQLGTSLRAYRRWLRAFQVVRAYAGGLSLTEAAFAAGFASSPHLSTVAREQFGIRPSDILHPANRAAIQVMTPPIVR